MILPVLFWRERKVSVPEKNQGRDEKRAHHSNGRLQIFNHVRNHLPLLLQGNVFAEDDCETVRSRQIQRLESGDERGDVERFPRLEELEHDGQDRDDLRRERRSSARGIFIASADLGAEKLTLETSNPQLVNNPSPFLSPPSNSLSTQFKYSLKFPLPNPTSTPCLTS